MTDHWIVRITKVPCGRQTWHRVTCGCGWDRKYVSRYVAEVRHRRHAMEGRVLDLRPR
jgi:hypothetical protein